MCLINASIYSNKIIILSLTTHLPDTSVQWVQLSNLLGQGHVHLSTNITKLHVQFLIDVLSPYIRPASDPLV